METFFISTPIYYVNARPHLGHAYTTILADCINRFQRLTGKDTFFLTGTDEHGDKIVQAAEEHGKEPQGYVDAISRQFKELWPELGVEPDRFIRTTEAEHVACVQRILQQVYDNGDIYYGDYGGYYCFGCECFYTEWELEGGRCPDHQKELEYIQETNYFFRMRSYQDWLREYIQARPDFIQPEGYRKEVLAMLREPVDDLCISRPKTRLTWGIELPFDTRYVTYVWFDALINYISALGWPEGEKFAAFWPNSHHVVAKDILKPHAIFWPTMLKAAGIAPYKGLRVHGYWKVEEAKMSKSLGNVVEPLALRKKYGLDGFRYFLMREMHFGHDGNFSEQALVNRFNADLANDLGNLFNRSLAMTHKYFQGQVPEAGSDLRAEDQELIALGKDALQRFMSSFQSFQTAEGLECLWEFVRGVNKYIDQMAPWSLNKQGEKERLATVMAMVLACLKRIALAVWPVMPGTAETMCSQLGLQLDLSRLDLREEASSWQLLEGGSQVAKKSNLFPRQEFQPEAGEQKSEDSVKTQEESRAEEIEFQDFQKLELRVGTVIESGPHPKADRLLRLRVDIGEAEPRQIVAGLAGEYAPEDLLGRQVVVVANLKPRKLRGSLSEGMVLAVHHENGLGLVQPSLEVEPGSRVS